jgi:hypothetical protein
MHHLTLAPGSYERRAYDNIPEQSNLLLRYPAVSMADGADAAAEGVEKLAMADTAKKSNVRLLRTS